MIYRRTEIHLPPHRTTKNVTGRLLVGLRWWHQVREDGTEDWQFESLEVLITFFCEGFFCARSAAPYSHHHLQDKSNLNSQEVLIFWGALIGAPILWALIAIGLIFRFKVFFFELSFVVIHIIILVFHQLLPFLIPATCNNS